VAQAVRPGGVPLPPGQNPKHASFIYAGLKSHGEGAHYPQFLADWSKVLTQHGPIAMGALHAPSSAIWEACDVVVIYKGRRYMSIPPIGTGSIRQPAARLSDP